MAPPANDNFAAATSIATSSGTLSGTTFDATKEATESTTIGTTVQTVWYTFTAPSAGWYKFWVPRADIIDHDTRSWDNSSLSIRVFPDGVLTAMTLTNETCDSNSGTGDLYDIAVVFFAGSGTTFRIRVSSGADGSLPANNNTQTCDFTLHWASLSRPATDDLASITSLGSAPVTATGKTTFDATFETSEVLATTLGGIGYDKEQSVWFTFTPSVTGKYRIATTNVVARGNHPVQSILQISTQSTLAGYTTANELGRVNFGGGGSGDHGASGYFNLTSGVTYYIRVSSAWANKNSGYAYNANACDFDLSITLSVPPVNDNFANATTLSTTLPGSVTTDAKHATQEAGEPTSGFPNNPEDQSIWYKFTPTTTGLYRLTIPRSSLVYTGDGVSPSEGFVEWAIAEITAVSQFDSAHFVAGTSTGFSQWDDTNDSTMNAALTAGHTYYIRFWLDGTPFNVDAMTFDFEYDLIVPSSNDNFANAISLTGASGTQDFTVSAANTVETGEPDSMYWNGGTDTLRTVWFDWLCPTTGDYVFSVGNMESTTHNCSFDLAVWTGSAVNALTLVKRNWWGSEPPNYTDYRNSHRTALGFHAVAGTHYKIQIDPYNVIHTNTRLTWRTNTVVGDTAATAGPLPNGRIDNYGHTNTDPPPNAVSLLSSHGSWWFTDGQPGAVRWFKKTFSADTTITLNARQWSGWPIIGTGWNMIDCALIAYKGANYAGLTVAQNNLAENVAMMQLDFIDDDGESGELTNTSLHADQTINMLAGETLWVAVFGIYDADYTASIPAASAIDAPQFDLDLFIPSATPVNDEPQTASFTHAYYFDRSEFGGYWIYPEAGLRDGTTIGASAHVGEGALAGFAATRTVWYHFGIDKPGTFKIWVEGTGDYVLGLYGEPFTWTDVTDLTLITSDDDSGPGSNPEINYTFGPLVAPFYGDYWIAVDSKAEDNFTLKYQRQSIGTAPGNDNFASATVISTLPAVVSGTTVAATTEPGEREAYELSTGPKDTVWYKYVATFNGQVSIRATCNTNNDDAYVYVDTWQGTTLAGLVRNPEPPPTGPGGGIFRGFFSYFDTPDENKGATIAMNVVSGQTYYIRVQTESGGSEDFTIYVDTEVVYVDIQPSGSDEHHGTLIDAAEVYVDIRGTGVDVFHQATTSDADTVLIDIQPGGIDIKGKEYVDVGTVYYNVSVLSHDCHNKWDSTQLSARCYRRLEATSLGRWNGTQCYRRFEVIAGDGLEEC